MYRKQRYVLADHRGPVVLPCLAVRAESAQSTDQEALRKLVNELFSAYARKDLHAFLSL